MAKKTTAVSNEINHFLPMFLAKADRIKLTKLLLPYYQSRMGLYFKRYGCLRCGRRDVPHYCGGMCAGCSTMVCSRLKTLDRKYGALFKARESEAAKNLLRRLTSAKKLLRDLKEIL